MDVFDVLRRVAEALEVRRRELFLEPQVTPQQIQTQLEIYTFQQPLPLSVLSEQLSELLFEGIQHTTHPRYFGLFNPTTDLSGFLADALTALFNPQVGSWDFAPVACELEQLVFKTTASRLAYPFEAAHFTSGGSEANHTAVNVALSHRFPRIGCQGLRALPGQPLVYISEEGHHSFDKILHTTGLGREALRRLPATGGLAFDLEQLAKAVAGDRAAGYVPFMVVGTSGTTNAGVIDPLDQLAEYCREQQLWFHVDGAWGAAAAFSDQLRGSLKGIQKADSITLDPHKWLSVPMGAGMFLCRHHDAVINTFGIHTAYIPESGGDGRFYNYRSSMQWSRRFIGLKLFTLLATQGLDGIARRLDHQTAMGEFLRQRLVASDWRILNETPFPLVCFDHPRLVGDGVGMQALAGSLAKKQIAWLSTTKLRNQIPCMRACITNYLTTAEDVDILVTALDADLAGS